MPNPHAAQWTNPHRLLKFISEVRVLLQHRFPDLSPSDVHLCYGQLMSEINYRFAEAAAEDEQRRDERELDKTPTTVSN